MKYAFVFPGQGSQHIGMGLDLYRNFKSAKDVFDEVDEALGQHLFDLMTSGSDADLTLTTNAQPAIMAVSIATLNVLEQEFGLNIKDKITFVAGHSLGEYSAACAAGVFSLANTAKLLRLRGSAMQQAVPVGMGAMAAILGVALEDVGALIEAASDADNYCVLANDNIAGQVVLSGHTKAIERAVELAPEFNAKKAVMLNVSAPFHSPLMKSAEQVMADALSKVSAKDSMPAIVQNVTALPETKKDVIIKNLVAQVTATVRWRETMDFLNEQGITDIVELGPSSVLTNMCKRAYKNIYAVAPHSGTELEEIANNL